MQNVTQKKYLVIDTILSSDSPLLFQKNLLEKNIESNHDHQ